MPQAKLFTWRLWCLRSFLFAPALVHAEVLCQNAYCSSKVHRREGYLATVQIQPVKFTLLRCISAELFFSCCDSDAAQLVITLHTQGRILPLSCCTAAELFITCCGSVSAPLTSPFFSRVLPACRFFSSREISHMQASQCGK